MPSHSERRQPRFKRPTEKAGATQTDEKSGQELLRAIAERLGIETKGKTLSQIAEEIIRKSSCRTCAGISSGNALQLDKSTSNRAFQAVERRFWYLITLSLVGFVTSFGAHVVAVNLPVYARSTGTGLFEIGLLLAAYDFAELLAKPVFGSIADKRGMVAATVAGLLVFSFASLLYLFLDPRLLLVTRILQGLGAAAFSTSSMALVAQIYEERKGRAFGVYNSIKGAGFVLGPVLGGAIVFYSGFSSIFVVSFLVGITMVLPASRVKYRAVPTPGIVCNGQGTELRQLVTSFGDAKLLPWYLLSFANMVLMGALFGFLPIYVSSLGYNQLWVGAIVGLSAVVYVVIQPFGGSFADKYGPRLVTVLGSAASLLAIILLPFLSGFLLVVDSGIAAAGIGVVWTVTGSAAADMADKNRMGLVMGNLGSYKEVGDMVGPVIVGGLAQAVSIQAGFVGSGLLAAVVTLPLLVTRRKRARSS